MITLGHALRLGDLDEAMFLDVEEAFRSAAEEALREDHK